MRELIYKYKILCIDDNPNNLFTLSALLSTQENILPLEATDAKKALDILLTQPVDLILCDVKMPDINGFEFAKLIQSNSRTKDIPIIFITAIFIDDIAVGNGFELGAVDYIIKPIDDVQLLNKISLYLNIFDDKNEILKREKMYYDILQSSEDGIFTIDSQGKNTFINKKALELLGFKKKQLLGSKIHDYIHYKDNKNTPHLEKNCCIYDVLKTQEIYKNNNEVLVKKDGNLLAVSLRVTPMYDDNVVSGLIVVFKPLASSGQDYKIHYTE